VEQPLHKNLSRFRFFFRASRETLLVYPAAITLSMVSR
jgi:hypothetical protein